MGLPLSPVPVNPDLQSGLPLSQASITLSLQIGHYPVYSWAFKFHMHTEVEPSALARYSILKGWDEKMTMQCYFSPQINCLQRASEQKKHFLAIMHG